VMKRMNDSEGWGGDMNHDMNRIKLDEALHAARERLASTAVPEQDAAVAKAHMLAAFHRAQLAAASAQPAAQEQRSRSFNFAGSLAGAGGDVGNSVDGKSGGKNGPISARMLALGATILLIVWLLTPVNMSANSSDLLGVSEYSTQTSTNNSTKTNLSNLAAGFMPLVSGDALAEAQHGWIVPTEMPLAELASLGLPFDASRAGDTVRAELLMNESGEVLAVRVLPDADVASSAPAAIEQSLAPRIDPRIAPQPTVQIS
jgi:hypothetical protein